VLAPVSFQGGSERPQMMRMQKQGDSPVLLQVSCWTYHSCFESTRKQQTNCRQNSKYR